MCLELEQIIGHVARLSRVIMLMSNCSLDEVHECFQKFEIYLT